MDFFQSSFPMLSNGFTIVEYYRYDGSLAIMGVNTFLGEEGKHIQGGEQELVCSTEQEKNQQASNVEEFREMLLLRRRPVRRELSDHRSCACRTQGVTK